MTMPINENNPEKYSGKEGDLSTPATSGKPEADSYAALKQELEASEERYRLLFENTTDGIYLLDRDLRITAVSSHLGKLLGRTLGDIEGKKITDLNFMAPESVEMAVNNMRKVMAGEAVPIARFKVIAVDGQPRYQDISVSPLIRDGKIVGGIGVARDVTDQKRAEETLKASEEKYRTLLENANEGIAVVQDDRFKFFNPRFQALTGYSTDEILSMPAINFIYPDDRDLLINYQMNKVKGEGIGNMCTCRYVTRSGEVRWMELNIAVIEWENKIASIGFFTDITERIKALQEIKVSNRTLQQTLSDAVDTMARIVEIRDPYTSGHQRRVATLSAAIAVEMGLDEATIHRLQMAAIIHDIGKIYVPAEILSKPGKLGELEFGLIKTHPGKGFDIVKGINLPCSIAQTVKQHHERMDGSGYPDGLMGKDILPEARILAVADVVEAMASHRPYRVALGIDTALEEILANRGKLYDPAAVDACVKLFREKGFKFED